MLEYFWDEFFAVEKMTARMVNNIAGPSIGGVSANIYIYMLIALTAAAWLSFGLKDPGRKLLIIIFIFWSLMEARMSLNYLSYFKDDLSTLFGKSLDEKRALTSPPGLYEFTQLVKTNVPPGAKLAVLNPPDEYLNIKLNYYLAPYNAAATSEAEYIAGCYVQPTGYNVIANTQYGWVAKK